MNYFRKCGEKFLVNQISLWMLGGCEKRNCSVCGAVFADPVILANVDQVMALLCFLPKQAYFSLNNRSVIGLINIACCKKILFTRYVKLAGDLLKREHKALQKGTEL